MLEIFQYILNQVEIDIKTKKINKIFETFIF